LLTGNEKKPYPSIDAHETTEKGSINQKAVLANRAALVDVLYTERPPSHVIQVAVP
jgi:feruloyl-CoA synthase